MARDLDHRQQAELTDFVNRLAQLGGYTTTAEWARQSGYPASNLSNLRNARGGVDGYNLLRLIRAAAERMEIQPEELAVTTARVQAEDAGDEMIASRLDELAGLVSEALELLRAAAERPGRAADRNPKAAAG
jgi:hypothetical protein